MTPASYTMKYGFVLNKKHILKKSCAIVARCVDRDDKCSTVTQKRVLRLTHNEFDLLLHRQP